MRDLSSMLRMGMPLVEALRFLERDDATPEVRKIAAAMSARVEAGEDLGTAARGSSLPSFVVSMLGLGQRTESLPQILERLSEHFDAMRRVQARAREAMLYPSAVLLTCVITALILQNSLRIFEPAESAWNANFGFRWGIWFLMGMAGAGLAAIALQATAAGEWLRWHLPFARSIWRDAGLVANCRSMALALQAGSSLPAAVEMAESVERNPAARAALRRLRDDVEKGLPLSVALRVNGAFPPTLAEAAATGEGSEDVPQAFMEAAGLYERILDFRAAAALAWLEPALLMGVGGVVAVVLLTFWGLFYNWAGHV